MNVSRAPPITARTDAVGTNLLGASASRGANAHDARQRQALATRRDSVLAASSPAQALGQEGSDIIHAIGDRLEGAIRGDSGGTSH
jgi:hypothetical protein